MEELAPRGRKSADFGRMTLVLDAIRFDSGLAGARFRASWRRPGLALALVGLLGGIGLLGGCSFQASMKAGGESKTAANETATEPPPATEPAPVEGEAAAAPEAPKAKVKVRGAKLEPEGGIFFQPNDATFQPGSGSEAVLAEVKTYLEQNPRVTRLRIEGHTNNTRPPDQSLTLSGQRAVAVKQWLITNGVNAGRLLSVGFGETQPIANNADATGAAQNERIQFRIVELDGKPFNNNPDPLAGGTEFP
jgi:OOP family OmpA-OmpF porin